MGGNKMTTPMNSSFDKAVNGDWDNAILETALNILSLFERQNRKLQFTASEVKAHLPLLGSQPNDDYIQMILDDEFSKRYEGKQVVYFLKIKG